MTLIGSRRLYVALGTAILIFIVAMVYAIANVRSLRQGQARITQNITRVTAVVSRSPCRNLGRGECFRALVQSASREDLERFRGPRGQAGRPGGRGAAGRPGAVGPRGPMGPVGRVGIGVRGPSGTMGAPGRSGTMGTPGAQGVPGPVGPQFEPDPPAVGSGKPGGNAPGPDNGKPGTAPQDTGKPGKGNGPKPK